MPSLDQHETPERIFLSELDVRPEVAKFALAMEEKLRENDWKGGWEGMGNAELLLRVRQEIDELEGASEWAALGIPTDLLGESVDVANFCMMFADNNGRLK